MSAPVRALGAILLAGALLLPLAAGASAAEPPQPVPGYRPAFVTEREAVRPWVDCLWASAAMLVDKWSAGQVTISKDRLRRLSGDRAGGSTLEHLTVALARLGIRATTSPDGGAVVTWPELKRRLAAGGGAILLGNDSKLPRWFGRWDPAFWRKTGENDNHALYVDGYDRRRNRFWVMDPLAPASWRGEWISGPALRRYAWKTLDGGLFTLMTPKAVAAPFSNVTLHDAVAFAGLEGLHVMWPVAKAPQGWKLPAVRVTTKVTRLKPAAAHAVSPAGIALSTPARLPGAAAAPVAKTAPTVRYGDAMLQVLLTTPAAPGVYAVAVSLREQRFGRSVAGRSLTLYVPGERRATIETQAPMGSVEVGRMQLDARIANAGALDWGELRRLPGAPPDAIPQRRTRLVGTWFRLDPGVTASPAAAAPIDLGPLPLAAGEAIAVRPSVPTPTAIGRWALVLDIVDDLDGSFAANGSKPGAIIVDLVETQLHLVAPH